MSNSIDKKIELLREKLNDLSVFNEVINLINSKKDIGEILHIVITRIADLIKAEAWSLLLVDDVKNELFFFEAFGEKRDDIKHIRLKIGQGIAGWVAKYKKPVIVKDTSRDKRFFHGVDEITRFRTKSVLAVPLITKDRLIGVIEVINKIGKSSFTRDDLNRIKAYIDQTAIAIENANLVNKLKERIRDLTLIFNIGRYITSILSIEKLLQVSAELIKESFNFLYVAIALKENRHLTLKGFSGVENILPRRSLVKVGEGLSGFSTKYKKSIIVDNVSKDKRYLRGIEGVRSEMAVPIVLEKKVLGVIDIGSDVPFSFQQEHKNLVEQIASQLAIAIENAQLYQTIKNAALTDDLTGLYNARYAFIYLDEITNQAVKEDFPVSLIFFDLDHFKWVNDNFGHLVGGKLLKEVAKRVKKHIIETDAIIRYGGDEYIIIIPRMPLEQSVEKAEFLRKKVGNYPFGVKKNLNYRITASFGVSEFPGASRDALALIRDADMAMYWVKENGRNGTAYFSNKKIFPYKKK